jgi:hypothetical protein
MKILAAALALLTLPACAQSWVKVAAENSGVLLTLPAGTQYRFGTALTATANKCGTLGWLPATVASTTQLSAYYTSFACDPAPGVVKELDVMQTTADQKIVVVTNGTIGSVTVPALVAAKPAVTVLFSWSLSGCILDVNSDGTATIRSGCVVTKK